MTTLTTFEYTELEYEVVKDGSQTGVESKKLLITERALEWLESLNERLKFASIGRKRIKFLNYAGILSLDGIKLEILPKFLKREYEKKLMSPSEVESRELILSNLLQMLKYTERLKVKEVNFAELGYEKDFFEIFVYLFANNLLRLLKINQHADYVRKHENLRFVKGRIDVRRYCSNPAMLHKIPCTYYDRSMNTPINRTLKYVSYLLARRVEDRNNYRLLRQITAILEPVDLTPVTSDYAARITFNRLNSEFKPYIDFCRLVLEGGMPSLQGSRIEFLSFLFPMEKLFEEFIAEVIKRENLHETIFGKSKLYIQKEFGYLVRSPEKMFALKPDIVIETGVEKYVIDTKYKLLDPEDRRLGVSHQDLYQMYAYCREIGASRAMLLYPRELNSELDGKILTLGDGNNEIEIHVRTISFHHDLKTKIGRDEFVIELEEALECLKIL